MKILHLTLYREFFDEVLAGTKTEEYRLKKPYWIKRLRGRQYDRVYFKNGYRRDARFIEVVCNGIEETDDMFIIKLGNILDVVADEHQRIARTLWTYIATGEIK